MRKNTRRKERPHDMYELTTLFCAIVFGTCFAFKEVLNMLMSLHYLVHTYIYDEFPKERYVDEIDLRDDDDDDDDETCC